MANETVPTTEEQIEEMKAFFEEMLEEAADEGLTKDDRIQFLNIGLTVAVNELYRIENEVAPEDKGIVDPRIMILLQQLGLLLKHGGDAKVSQLVDPTGDPMKVIEDGKE